MPILSIRSVQNFDKASALVFEKSSRLTSKIHVQNKRRPIRGRERERETRGMEKDFKNLSLLKFYSDLLETLGKYSWHVVPLYKLLRKKIDFLKF